MSLRAGFAKVDITVLEPGMAMLGWGQPTHVPRRVAHPLHARALAIAEGGRTLVYVVADLCFISASVRVGVIAELRRRGAPIAEADVMLTATHTHAGPNGFSHAFFYDLSSLGFSRLVYDTVVRGIVDAIVQAQARLEPARLHLGVARVEGDVAVNRSPSAYSNNPEARGEGVDRELVAVRVDDARGRGLGVLSLFALHATSVHADTLALHPDHKGLAAEAFETWASAHGHAPDFVALFAQGAAGDVSPNVRFDSARGVMVGAMGDDEASALYVADAQVDATRRAFEGASLELSGPLDAAARHVDFERRFVRPRFAGGAPARTTEARLGLAMAAGTAEGPGPLAGLPLLRRLGTNDAKLTLLRVGPGVGRRLVGLDPRRLPIPHAAFAHARRAGGLDHAWIPTVLPVQVMRIGRFAIAALPNEPTTTVGHRLRGLLEPLLAVDRLHVQGYANAYSGYLTTPEEYARQRYEGAYTLFGPHTLGAFSDALVDLAESLDGVSRPIAGPGLPVCTEAELATRAFAVTSNRADRGAGP